EEIGGGACLLRLNAPCQYECAIGLKRHRSSKGSHPQPKGRSAPRPKRRIRRTIGVVTKYRSLKARRRKDGSADRDFAVRLDRDPGRNASACRERRHYLSTAAERKIKRPRCAGNDEAEWSVPREAPGISRNRQAGWPALSRRRLRMKCQCSRSYGVRQCQRID